MVVVEVIILIGSSLGRISIIAICARVDAIMDGFLESRIGVTEVGEVMAKRTEPGRYAWDC